MHATSRLRSTRLFVLGFLAFVPSTFGARGADEAVPPNEKAIADVQAGRVTTADASWWGFQAKDATQALQAAFDSPAPRVLVPNMGRPWIVTPLELPSNKRITFEADVIVEAKRGAFRGRGDCLFTANGCTRLTVLGNGATFRMHKDDYHQPPYELAEWRHALAIRGCEDVTIEGLTLRDSGGDGVYLGVGTNNATNRNVTIRDVVCAGNNRQGISVISAENLLIENCLFRDTRGTAPEAGIDFEPNRPEERLVNCVLRNCRSEGNAGHAYHFYLGQLRQDSEPLSIRLENCSSQHCERYSAYVGVANRAGERTVRGSIEFVECSFVADRGAGVYIRGNEADGCLVRLERCEIERRDKSGSRLAPITIEAPRQPDVDVGNVHIDRCTIRDTIDRRPIALAASPMTRLRGLAGSLTCESPGGKVDYVLNKELLAEWFPRQGLIDQIPRFPFVWQEARLRAAAEHREVTPGTFCARTESEMLVWGTAGHAVEFAAELGAVGRRVPVKGVLVVTEADGTTTNLDPRVDGDRLSYAFRASTTGPQYLRWQGDSTTTFRVISCSAPFAYLATSRGVNLIRPVGILYFTVPGNVSRFALQVSGAGTAETVKATIRDAANRVVATQDDIASPHLFLLEREDHVPPEIWSIRLEKATAGVLEDVAIQTLGIPPLFATSPDYRFTSAEAESGVTQDSCLTP
jgi:hypothetical protein